MQRKNQIFSIAKETDYGQLKVEMTTEGFEDIEKHAFVHSIGVLGDQKMGKSTLVNNLFGTNFEVGSNLHERTTEGINGQSLSQSGLSYDKIMILDCEGANSYQKESEIHEVLHQLNEKKEENKFTETELLEETKKLLIASDIRYCLFLWCSIDCLVYLIPNKPPTRTDIHFFINISNKSQIIRNSQHKPTVLLVYRDSEQDQCLEESYIHILEEHAPAVQELCHLQFVSLRKFRKLASEKKYQEDLDNFKQLIFETIKTNKSEMFSLQSWCDTLVQIAENLNHRYELPDINSLRAQLELQFILRRYGTDVENIANALDQMLKKREEYIQVCSLPSYNEFLQHKNSLLQKHQDEEQNGKIGKTVSCSAGLISGVASLACPPLIVFSIISGGFSMFCESQMNKEKEATLKKYLEQFEKTLTELKKIKEVIDAYYDACKQAKDVLHLHDYYLNMIELYYGLARKILQTRKEEPKAEEIVQFMFKLFQDNNNQEEQDRRQFSNVILNKNQTQTPSEPIIYILKSAGQNLNAVSSAVLGYSKFGTKTFQVLKFGGVAFAGLLDAIEIFGTWNRQDPKILFDRFKQNEIELQTFIKELEHFSQHNKERLEEISYHAGKILERTTF